MKKGLVVTVVLLAVVAIGLLYAEEKAPPKDIVFEAKMGNVTFSHATHLEKVGKDCKACHDAIFKQEKGNLGYKEAMHKKAEEAKTSCATCHHAGGKAFESKGNCTKCHIKK